MDPPVEVLQRLMSMEHIVQEDYCETTCSDLAFVTDSMRMNMSVMTKLGVYPTERGLRSLYASCGIMKGGQEEEMTV